MAGKKVKLKARLQNALIQKQQKKMMVSQSKSSSSAASSKQPVSTQHDPTTMTMRHMWSDGRETETPYRASRGQHILVIGDGDLSFSAALSESLGPEAGIVCTTLDSREALERKYGPGLIAANLARLKDATIIHGVDGTKLTLSKQLARHAYSRVVFNYPHTGAGIKDRDRNIRAQQEMLRGFLGAACTLLERQPRIRGPLTRSALSRSIDAPLIGKRRRQTGKDDDDASDIDVDEEDEVKVMRPLEPEIHITLRTGDPYDAWNVKGLGASISGLRAAESFRFEPAKYPGYRHVKTMGEAEEAAGDEEDFLMKPAKTFVFRLKPL